MANKYKGVIEFKAGEDSYKLSFSANAMVEVTDVLGLDLDQIIALMQSSKISLVQLRLMFWQGLIDHQPDTALDDAKRILSKLLPTDLGRLVGEALLASLPDAVKSEVADAGAGSPPTAARKVGTGKGS